MRAAPNTRKILARLRAMGNPDRVAGMARFGVDIRSALGISIPALRALARETGRDHALALELWASGLHEARILASFVAEPAKVTPALMDRWAADFSSWDLCDQCCLSLFDKTPHAWKKAVAWSRHKKEFVRRAGFSMMACLAVHDKAAPDAAFRSLFREIERASDDERIYVRKAVNWALRQIGKRNARLRRDAVSVAKRIAKRPSRAAKWIAADALRELESPAVKRRVTSR